jgi:hypothetical protein
MVLYAYMCCVCVLSVHRESPDIILGDKPFIFEVVLSHCEFESCNIGKLKILLLLYCISSNNTSHVESHSILGFVSSQWHNMVMNNCRNSAPLAQIVASLMHSIHSLSSSRKPNAWKASLNVECIATQNEQEP